MEYDARTGWRRSHRLPRHDYSEPGAYYVTICTSGRLCWFGHVVDERMVENDTGFLAHAEWKRIPTKFDGWQLEEYIVMPNHLHGILVRAGGASEGAINRADSLGAVRAFKAATTHGVRASGLAAFEWQTDYYDHVVRGEQDLERIRQYIRTNPARWSEDPENPARRPNP